MTNQRQTGREPRGQVHPVEATQQPEEVLVPDGRNGLTPSQMVEAKLQVLLGRVPPGLFGHFRRPASMVR